MLNITVSIRAFVCELNYSESNFMNFSFDITLRINNKHELYKPIIFQRL